MCAQGNCPLQQAAPSRRECHRNRPRQSLLSPDFGYAPAAAACASEPGVLSHMARRLLPHASVSLVFPVNLVMARRLLHAAMGPAFQRLEAP